jgi:hypothetical protein
MGLVEMAAVIAVLGLAAWAGLAALGSHGKDRLRGEAKAQLDDLMDGLVATARVTNRLPCPDVEGGKGTSGDGLEDVGDDGSCVASEGALPWLTLGLTDQTGRDPWHRPIRYAVTPAATAPDALSGATPWPEGELTLAEGNGGAVTALALVMSLGANGAQAPGKSGAEWENRDQDAHYRLSAGAGDADAATFDDLLVPMAADGLAVAMGRAAALATATVEALTLPTTTEALTAVGGLSWTARELGGVVADSGLVSVVLPGVTLQAKGGTLAADGTAADRGLGVYSATPPLTDTPALVEGGELGLDATGSSPERALTMTFDQGRTQVGLSLSGLEGWRDVDRSWLRANDTTPTRCLTPVTPSGRCRVAWREGARLEFLGASGLLGRLELRGCPTQGIGGTAVFSNLSLGGVVFESLRLVPLMVVDAKGAPIPGEGSFFRLAALTVDRDGDSLPATPSPVEGCP